jgi:hypothetical protein
MKRFLLLRLRLIRTHHSLNRLEGNIYVNDYTPFAALFQGFPEAQLGRWGIDALVPELGCGFPRCVCARETWSYC